MFTSVKQDHDHSHSCVDGSAFGQLTHLNSIMALAIVNYLAFFIPIHGLVLKLVAVVFVLIFMGVHIRSVEGGGNSRQLLQLLKFYHLHWLLVLVYSIFRGIFYYLLHLWKDMQQVELLR